MEFDKKKVMEHLWTARWYLTQKPDMVGAVKDEVSKALVLLGDKWEEANTGTPVIDAGEEPDRISVVMPDDFGLTKIESPNIVRVKQPFVNRGAYQTPSGMFEGLVIHYAVSGRTSASAKGVLRWLHEGDGKYNKGGLMCMTMDENGIIYVPEKFDIYRNWGHHAGKSKWKQWTSVSNRFAGLEVCCWGRNPPAHAKGPFRESKGEANIIAGRYEAFTEAQVRSLINFLMNCKLENPNFSFDNVVGHDELRAEYGLKGDKQDPGASLPWTMPEFRELLKKEWEQVKPKA